MSSFICLLSNPHAATLSFVFSFSSCFQSRLPTLLVSINSRTVAVVFLDPNNYLTVTGYSLSSFCLSPPFYVSGFATSDSCIWCNVRISLCGRCSLCICYYVFSLFIGGRYLLLRAWTSVENTCVQCCVLTEILCVRSLDIQTGMIAYGLCLWSDLVLGLKPVTCLLPLPLDYSVVDVRQWSELLYTTSGAQVLCYHLDCLVCLFVIIHLHVPGDLVDLCVCFSTGD